MRQAEVKRTTKETDIAVAVNLDGSGKATVATETSLGYYREFLAREALRHVEHEAS